MSGLLLRLAGPMQSWGEHSAFGRRDTLAHPTRSGLIGLFAAARGIPRGGDLGQYDDAVITVRVDRPGDRMVDYQTTGGGLPAKRSVPKSEGGYRPKETSTIQTWRSYLAGAVFTVAVEARDDVLAFTAEALERPYWQPYLGRRAFIPEQPMLLRARVEDPVTELREQIPLPPRRARRQSVDFVHETAAGDRGSGKGVRTVLNDVPAPALEGDGVERSFFFREVTVERRVLPEYLETSDLAGYRLAIATYLTKGRRAE